MIQGASGQRADVLRSSDHQRHERGAELEDSDGKKNSYGFRNRDHLKTAIFFHCGGLELYPPFRARKKESIARKPGGRSEHFATNERISW